MAEPLAKSYTDTESSSTVASELKTLLGELEDQTKIFNKALETIDSTKSKVEYGEWDDPVQDRLDDYFNNTIVATVNGVKNSLSNDLQGAITTITTMQTEATDLNRNQTSYNKLMEHPESETIKQYKDKNGTISSTWTEGAEELNPITNPKYGPWKEEKDRLEKAMDGQFETINSGISSLAETTFTPPVAASETAPGGGDESIPDPAAQTPRGEIVDGGIIVDGVRYTTVPVGQNLVHGNVDKGTYVVYNGQIYTYGGPAGGGKGLLISLDGEPIEVTGKELAGSRFVSGYYLSRGTPVGD